MSIQFEINLTNGILYYEELEVVLTNERVIRKLYFTNTIFTNAMSDSTFKVPKTLKGGLLET